MKTVIHEGTFAVRKKDALPILELVGDYNRSGSAPLGLEIFVNSRVLAGSGIFQIGITFGAEIVLGPVHYPGDKEISFKYTVYQNPLNESEENDGR